MATAPQSHEPASVTAMDDRARQCNGLGFPLRRRGGAIDAGGSSMSATEPVTESGAAPDGAARFAIAMSEVERILARARSRVRRAEDVTQVREAFSCLAEAEQCVQEG